MGKRGENWKKGENPPKGKGEKVYTARDHLLCSCSCGYSCGDFLLWAWKKGEKRGEKGEKRKKGEKGKKGKKGKIHQRVKGKKSTRLAIIYFAAVAVATAAAIFYFGPGKKGKRGGKRGERKKGEKGANPPKGKGEKVNTARNFFLCSCSCGYSCAGKKGEKRGNGKNGKKGKKGGKGENPPKGKGEKVNTARDFFLCSCSCGYSCARKKGEKRGKGKMGKRGKKATAAGIFLFIYFFK